MSCGPNAWFGVRLPYIQSQFKALLRRMPGIKPPARRAPQFRSGQRSEPALLTSRCVSSFQVRLLLREAEELRAGADAIRLVERCVHQHRRTWRGAPGRARGKGTSALERVTGGP